MSDTIICPNCQVNIEVTEAISAQLRAQLKQQFDAETRKRDQEFAQREASLKESRQELLQARHELEQSREAIDEQVASRLAEERKRIAAEALTKAQESIGTELKDAREQLGDLKQKLQQTQQAELDLRKQKRELEEQTEQLELTVARKLDEERQKIRNDAKREAIEETELNLAEREKVISDLRKQIAELKRQSEQSSQQLQGEVMELSLEDQLRREFPFDEIVPVPKGVHGGDVTQHVRDGNGETCGVILWESKRTKRWNGDWLPKLRDDLRAAKAQIAAIATTEMPPDLTTLGCIDGVWITNRSCVAGLATALRAGLIEAAKAKRALDGRQDKMTVLYGYLSGAEFRHRVEGIVESFVTLKDDLEKEKRSMQRMWAKREKQLERAVFSTSSLYGDLGAIIGASLPQIEQLELPALEGPDCYE
ncbi:MAG: DUF2130 domain-containing protein [Planctomycetaceae bacterium]|nr:DUF2130 domain-containing protein [Planctomycetaceae bacterium]